jgi:M6 family metalloprotease-like protein
MSSHRVLSALAVGLAVCAAAWGQASEPGQLRALNARILQLRGALASANAGDQSAVHSQAAAALTQRQAVLQSLMASAPARALELAFPADVLADLAAAFPASASLLEQRGTWRGALYVVAIDGVGFQSSREERKLQIGGQLVDFHSVEPAPAGSKCNEIVAASGLRSGNVLVAESSVSEGTAAGCSPLGAQKIAVILVNFQSSSLPAGVTQGLLNGIFLGNAFAPAANQATPDRHISDFWTQNSDGKTWVSSTGSGALTVVGPYTLPADYNYCTDSAPMRQAAYAAANAALDYNQFSRVVIVVPHNGTCNGTAGVATIGCWSGECPGDGACNISWTWWRADQIASRDWGVMLGTHELGHNLGVSHSGSRYHGAEVVGPIGTAGFRTEYNDRFATMGNWNTGFYNSVHSLNQLGWLSAANVATVTGTGTYTIQGIETRPSGVKALKVARGTGVTNAYFYIAYYPDRGNYIGNLSTTVHNGALIHYQDPATPGGKTDLLDFTPTVVDTSTTTPNFSNPILANGTTWSDPYQDVQLQVNNLDTLNNTMTVTVTYNPPPCTQTNPTVTFLTTSNSTSPGGSANYSVRVANNDSISCAPRNFTLSSALATPEPSISLTFSTGVLNLSPGAQGTATLTAATQAGTPLGTYVISASATAPAAGGGSHSDTTGVNASLTVQLIPPPAPSGVSATAVYTGNGRNKVFQHFLIAWNDVSGETSYTVERCQVQGKGKNATCAWGPLGSPLPANTTSITDAPAAGTYRYRVGATGPGGFSGWSPEVQVSH